MKPPVRGHKMMNKQKMHKKSTEDKEQIEQNGKHKPDDQHNKTIDEIFKETIHALADEIRREHLDAGLDMPADAELAKEVKKRLEKGIMSAKKKR